jgi:hypothetical protein
MRINEAGWDRALRVVLGLGLLAITVFGPQSMWGLIGLGPLATGLVGFCPLYRVFGFSTCAAKPAENAAMTRLGRTLTAIAVVASAGAVLSAQGGGMGSGMGGGMRGGMAMDATAQADMQVFHQLIDNRAKISRKVTPRPDGVESLTESDDPAVAKLIQTHVAAMAARVKEARPIHLRDPLFAEVFKHAGKIQMLIEETPRGLRVVETSTDAYAVKLIQAHAEVVSLFLANGHAEVMKNHAVPEKGK